MPKRAPRLEPVVEAPALENSTEWPWPVRPDSHGMIHLHAANSDAEVGSVIAQWLNYNSIDNDGSAAERIERLLEADETVLPGGLRVVAGDDSIAPSCCCGLETWREWHALTRGEGLWQGHDPAPWVERTATGYVVWSDGGLSDKKIEPAISFSSEELTNALRNAEQDLIAFANLLAPWAARRGLPSPERLQQHFLHWAGL